DDKRRAPEVGKPCLDFGIGKARVDFSVELVNDLDRRGPRSAAHDPALSRCKKRCLSKNKFFQHRSPRLAGSCLCAWELIEDCDANPFGEWGAPADDRLHF